MFICTLSWYSSPQRVKSSASLLTMYCIFGEYLLCGGHEIKGQSVDSTVLLAEQSRVF